MEYVFGVIFHGDPSTFRKNWTELEQLFSAVGGECHLHIVVPACETALSLFQERTHGWPRNTACRHRFSTVELC